MWSWWPRATDRRRQMARSLVLVLRGQRMLDIDVYTLQCRRVLLCRVATMVSRCLCGMNVASLLWLNRMLVNVLLMRALSWVTIRLRLLGSGCGEDAGWHIGWSTLLQLEALGALLDYTLCMSGVGRGESRVLLCLSLVLGVELVLMIGLETAPLLLGSGRPGMATVRVFLV